MNSDDDDRFNRIIQNCLRDMGQVDCSRGEYRSALIELIEEAQIAIQACDESENP